MNLIEKLTPDFVFNDNRGTITQLVHDGYKQINAVFTKKNSVRGNFHYHEKNEEAFFIISGQIIVNASYKGIKENYTFNSGDMFLIHKKVRHEFKYLEDTYLIGMYSGCVENSDGTKDIITDDVRLNLENL